MEETNKQHTQVPNNMAQDGLTPRDQLVYAVLHSYNNYTHLNHRIPDYKHYETLMVQEAIFH